jgi:hypothetical protein
MDSACDTYGRGEIQDFDRDKAVTLSARCM